MERENGEVSIVAQWELLSVHRSGVYYAPRPADERTLLIQRRSDEIYTASPFYGYRKLHKALARQQMAVGEHRLRRLLRQLGITCSVGKVRVQTTDSHHVHPRYPNRIKGLNLTRSDQVWVAEMVCSQMTNSA